ncbi:uncharacterized protein LOC126234004 [Schistocerca nitens]|uniref:uncharacterized protein LOC126234004 n=1 Tax=Schistocerca nitens TaxID=7011 RepID=UPI002118925C|nr:uncharacterized protein LOC126234004 [Schistocerca nitens]
MEHTEEREECQTYAEDKICDAEEQLSVEEKSGEAEDSYVPVEEAEGGGVSGDGVKDGRRRWYRLGEVLSVEEDERHEFKGHRNVCPEDIPPWCRRAQDTSSRTRSSISRNLCGFLNRGVGGVVLVGVLDSGVVVGSRLTPSQQQHLMLSLEDALARFRPPVPRHLWSVSFVPVLGPKDGLPTHRLAGGDCVCDKQHDLCTYMYCWCDYEAIARFSHGLIPMNYVVEITIQPINKYDQWVKELDPNSKVTTLPVFQADDAQIYMRKHSTLVRYSIRDVVEQAREEVLIQKMDKLMEAWKKCRMSEKLLDLWQSRVPEDEWKSIEYSIRKKKLEKRNKGSHVKMVIQDTEDKSQNGKIDNDENNVWEKD